MSLHDDGLLYAWRSHPIIVLSRKLSETHEAKREASVDKGKAFAEELHLIPDYLAYHVKTAWCTHGCTQEARGEGERFQAATRYTGCKARLTAEAKRDWETGQWHVEINKEVCTHGGHGNDRQEGSCFYSVHVSRSLSTTTRVTHQCLSRTLTRPRLTTPSYSKRPHRWWSATAIRSSCATSSVAVCTCRSQRRQLDNFKQYRLGGGHALESMRTLLERFLSFDGARCLVIDDADGVVCGLVLQTGMQRAMFQRWGDSLIMDWTHNTNNLGFYLGTWSMIH